MIAAARAYARRSLLVTALGLGAIAGACSSRRTVTAVQAPPPPPPHAVKAPVNDSPFAPAFTKLDESAGKLDAAQLGDPVQCTGCHADVVAQWDPSAHHGSSFTNRFYASAVDLTRKNKGNKASRWCAGCHDPSLLLDGEIDGDVAQASARAGDGVGCLLCHSISEPARLGGGGYTLKWRPFTEPDVKDAAQVAQHKAAMRPAVLGQAELCASCHKVSLHEDVNGKRWYRGQNDFDPWEQGPYALGGAKTAGQIYAPDVAPSTCQDCHMPKEAVTQGDLAGKADGSGTKMVRSHRFLAANTMLPTFAHDAATVDAQAKMLKDVVRVDVIAVRLAGNPLKAIPVEEAQLDSSSAFSIDVVVENDKVGHMFPTGTADSNQIWLALEVRDASGKLVADSGVLQKSGDLDAEAHTFNVMQLDNEGKPALLRDAHRFAATGWNNTIAPKDARVIRYALTLPGGDSVKLPLRVSARVLYRKFTAAYTTFACASKAASLPPLTGNCPKLPIIEVAKDEVTLGAPDDGAHASTPRWRRLDAYARGLLSGLQEDVGAAAPILTQVVTLEPKRAEGYIDTARLFIREGRTADAMAELDLAARIDPKTPVIPFLRGIAHYEVYRLGEAVEPLQLVIAGAPKNVMAFELLAEALELKGDDRSAIDVAQAGLRIDPEDAQLHHLEALGFDKLGLLDDAEIARNGYLKYRRDDDTPRLRSLCKKNVPGCAREANPLHVHELALHL